MTKKCLQCGRPLPKDQKHDGLFTRSVSVAIMDPAITFCTLRCAARYGVKAAMKAKERIL